jgi:beta-mannosidase
MAVQWTAGVVEPSDDEEPPEPESWEPVAVPGRPAAFAGAEAVAYRARFADPRSDGDQRALLDLAGAYAHARVWVDGEYLGRHDAYWAPATFEFEPSGETELIVECRAPTDRFGGAHATDRVPDELAVPGIWWGVGLRVRPETFLADLSVSPRGDGDGAVIDAAVTVDAGRAVDDSVTLSLRPEGFRGGGAMERVAVDAAAGQRVTVTKPVEVRDPSRWWPRGHGDQHRYTVRAKLGDDAVARTTGLCDVAYEDGDLRVNGRSVSARGFAVTPTDADPETLVERAAAANATLLRVRGHVAPPALYEAADEAGLLVWQDLPLVGPGGFDPERGREVATGVAGTVDHHPSVGPFSVHAGPTPPFDGPHGSGALARLRLRYRAWRRSYDAGDARTVAEALPAERTLPVVGGLGIDADATELFPGWEYGAADDVRWLLERSPGLGRAVGAFGAGALASDAADPPVDFDRGIHDARVDGGTEASQAHQARTLATVAEALRRRGCGLLAACCLRDARPGGGMGVLTAAGEAKPGYDRLSASYAPTVALPDDVPARASGVVVRNDRPEAVEATVELRAGGERVEEATTPAPAGETTAVEGLDLPDGEVELVLSAAGETVTTRYDLG